eukprot:1184450-Prorocentrum_minimum.AAC.2
MGGFGHTGGFGRGASRHATPPPPASGEHHGEGLGVRPLACGRRGRVGREATPNKTVTNRFVRKVDVRGTKVDGRDINVDDGGTNVDVRSTKVDGRDINVDDGGTNVDVRGTKVDGAPMWTLGRRGTKVDVSTSNTFGSARSIANPSGTSPAGNKRGSVSALRLAEWYLRDQSWTCHGREM